MSLSYREVSPHPSLARHIECYWFLRSSEPSRQRSESILPDGCMELVFNLSAPIRRLIGDGTSELQPPRMLVGQMDRCIAIQPTGCVDIVGVRFRPAGAYPFFRVPMSELANRFLPAESVLRIEDGLADSQSPESRSHALDRVLQAAVAGNEGDRDLDSVTAWILRAEGRMSVSEVARIMGVGSRQLERRFRERVGLAPKTFTRIVRFQSIFRRAPSDVRRWAELAFDCGYYDQAHFIKDFKRFTGESPAAFFASDNALTRVFTRAGRKSDPYNTAS
ncbi:MAG TPA: helix-turn-helix domain-containing protein [Vicinamibacteria bacterium]|nr:helix-turn-helix domain-containing protein [Vicinamibacteria bacterium]